jgi:uncharacterized membrane protein
MRALVGGWLLLALLATYFFFDRTPRRTLWFDELATWEIAMLPSFSDRVEALRQAADSMPPLHYQLASVGLALSSTDEIGLRLPSYFGLLLGMASIGWLIWRCSLNGLVALCGVSLVPLSIWLPYSLDARPYSLWLGALSLALALLFEARQRNQRPWEIVWWIAAGGAMALCLMTHHLAALTIPLWWAMILLPTRINDWRSRHKQISKSARFALVLPLLVVAWQWPMLRAFQQVYGKTFWAKPSWNSAVDCFTELLSVRPLLQDLSAHWIEVGVVAALLLLLLTLLSKGDVVGKEISASGISASVALLATPFLLLFICQITQGAITPRYAFPLVVGTICLAPLLAVKSPKPVLLTVTALTCAMSLVRMHHAGIFGFNDTQTQKIAGSLPFSAEIAQHPEKLVIVAGSLDFLPFHHYAPEQDRPKIAYVQEPQLAKAFTKVDTVELLFQRLPAHQSRTLISLASLKQTRRSFLLVYRPGYQEWLPFQLQRDGWRIQPLHQRLIWQLAVVERAD